MATKFRTSSLFFARSRSLFLLALFSLVLTLPQAVQAQSADPLQIFNNYYQAARAGNLEGMLSQYADNAVFKYLPSAPFPGPSTYTGLTEIRGVEKGALDAHLVPDCANPVVQGANVSSNCTVNNANLPFQIAFKETLNESENLVWLLPLSGVVVLAAFGLLIAARLRVRRPR